MTSRKRKAADLTGIRQRGARFQVRIFGGIDPGAVAKPYGGIAPMANILSRRRRTVRHDAPCATGVVSVGDAVACNNRCSAVVSRSA